MASKTTNPEAAIPFEDGTVAIFVAPTIPAVKTAGETVTSGAVPDSAALTADNIRSIPNFDPSC